MELKNEFQIVLFGFVSLMQWKQGQCWYSPKIIAVLNYRDIVHGISTLVVITEHLSTL